MEGAGVAGEDGTGGGISGKVAEVGVGERFCARGLRDMERLSSR